MSEELEFSIQSKEEQEAELRAQRQPLEKAGKSSFIYAGPERRRGIERRSGHDRREMLRFEPDKEKPDRRNGKDRRKTDLVEQDLWERRDLD